MSAFLESLNYRELIKDYLKRQPKNGRGELAKFAKHLGVNSTLISQVMSGSRDFSHEQALELAQHMGFSDLETEYFVLLVQYEKAGTQNLKSFLKKRIDLLKEQSRKLEKHYNYDRKLSDEERSVFYSSWLYSAVRLFTSIGDEGKTLHEICERFQIERQKVAEILRFLVQSGLCNENNGKYKIAVQNTFLEQGSPFFLKHHSNWRIKAIQKSEALSSQEMMFTSPMSLSKDDFNLMREELAKLLKKFSVLVKNSPAEEIACLNIDFFWIGK